MSVGKRDSLSRLQTLLVFFGTLYSYFFSETNMIIDATKLDTLQKRQVDITPVTDVELNDLKRKLNDNRRTRNNYQRQLDDNIKKLSKSKTKEKAERLQNSIENLNRKLKKLNEKRVALEKELFALEKKSKKPFDALELEILQKQVDQESALFQKRLRFFDAPHTIGKIYVKEKSPIVT